MLVFVFPPLLIFIVPASLFVLFFWHFLLGLGWSGSDVLLVPFFRYHYRSVCMGKGGRGRFLIMRGKINR